MSKDLIILKTPFVIQDFTSIDNFISTVFPNLESFLKEQLLEGIQESALIDIAYSGLKESFKLYIVRNYSKDIDAYLNKEAKHADPDAFKDVLLSTVSITLNIIDETGNKLMDSDYLNAIRNIVNKLT